jgi:hypothetical protein
MLSDFLRAGVRVLDRRVLPASCLLQQIVPDLDAFAYDGAAAAGARAAPKKRRVDA